ncbi:hypothetical protein [Streptomyces sp. C184]|uniref:hypothetical protein n=1 Tax=Streptomyces sp. C184 TaxID=3237121 RepID=UPI0034C60F58
MRDAVERHHRLRQDRPVVNTDAAAAMSPDDHRRGFDAAMTVLIAEFNAYPIVDLIVPLTDAQWVRDSDRLSRDDPMSGLFMPGTR